VSIEDGGGKNTTRPGGGKRVFIHSLSIGVGALLATTEAARRTNLERKEACVEGSLNKPY